MVRLEAQGEITKQPEAREVCAGCGTAIEPGSKFCALCGARV